MVEARFYHLQNKNFRQVLPDLLGKGLGAGHKIIVRLDKAEIDTVNDHLWTYDADSFLPHGSQRDGNAAMQPVWLTAENDNPNNATMLVISTGEIAGDASAYDLCCDIFDGQQDGAVEAARSRWKSYKDSGLTVTYWQQTDRGGWEKKA